MSELRAKLLLKTLIAPVHDDWAEVMGSIERPEWKLTQGTLGYHRQLENLMQAQAISELAEVISQIIS
jgi:hypothetical protein